MIKLKFGPLAYMFWEGCSSFDFALTCFSNHILITHSKFSSKSSGKLYNLNGDLKKEFFV